MTWHMSSLYRPPEVLMADMTVTEAVIRHQKNASWKHTL